MFAYFQPFHFIRAVLSYTGVGGGAWGGVVMHFNLTPLYKQTVSIITTFKRKFLEALHLRSWNPLGLKGSFKLIWFDLRCWDGKASLYNRLQKLLYSEGSKLSVTARRATRFSEITTSCFLFFSHFLFKCCTDGPDLMNMYVIHTLNRLFISYISPSLKISIALKYPAGLPQILDQIDELTCQLHIDCVDLPSHHHGYHISSH